MKYDSHSQLSEPKDELRSIGNTPKSAIVPGSAKIENKDLQMLLLEMKSCLNTKNRKIENLELKNKILRERVKDLEALLAKVFDD